MEAGYDTAAGCLMLVLAFTSASLLSLGAFLAAKRIRRERLNGGAMRDDESPLAWFLRRGVTFLVPLSSRACSIHLVSSYALRLVRVLGARGMETWPAQVLSVLMLVVFACVVLGSLLSFSLVFGFATASCVVLAVGFWARHEEELLADEFREAIPDALRTMQACFSVGHSLRQTFDQVADRSRGPLGGLFAKAGGVLASGGTVADSLECLKRGTGDAELVFLSTALEIQHRTGSSMQQVLDVTKATVEGDLEMRRSLRTQTAQARLSARIVTVMPFALVALFSLLSEGFLDPFFESVAGIVMLVCALAMQLAGILLVRKMLNVGVV